MVKDLVAGLRTENRAGRMVRYSIPSLREQTPRRANRIRSNRQRILPSSQRRMRPECFGMSLTSLHLANNEVPLTSFAQQPAGAEPNGPPGPNVWTIAGPALGNSPPPPAPPPIANQAHQRHMAQLSQDSINICHLRRSAGHELDKPLIRQVRSA
jgi:hypothetical protein